MNHDTQRVHLGIAALLAALVGTASAEYGLALAVGFGPWLAACVPAALDIYALRAFAASGTCPPSWSPPVQRPAVPAPVPADWQDSPTPARSSGPEAPCLRVVTVEAHRRSHLGRVGGRLLRHAPAHREVDQGPARLSDKRTG